MAVQIRLIRHGAESLKIDRWLVQEGMAVSRNQQILMITADNALEIIRAECGGILLSKRVDDGQTFLSGDLLAVIATREEAGNVRITSKMTVKDRRILSALHLPEERTVRPVQHVQATPAARKIALEYNIALEDIPGSGPTGRIQSEDVWNHLNNHDAGKIQEGGPLTGFGDYKNPGLSNKLDMQLGEVLGENGTGGQPSARSYTPVSPLAKRLAANAQVSLAGLHGSGPGGRIMKQDVLALIAERSRRSRREAVEEMLSAHADEAGMLHAGAGLAAQPDNKQSVQCESPAELPETVHQKTCTPKAPFEPVLIQAIHKKPSVIALPAETTPIKTEIEPVLIQAIHKKKALQPSKAEKPLKTQFEPVLLQAIQKRTPQPPVEHAPEAKKQVPSFAPVLIGAIHKKQALDASAEGLISLSACPASASRIVSFTAEADAAEFERVFRDKAEAGLVSILSGLLPKGADALSIVRPTGLGTCCRTLQLTEPLPPSGAEALLEKANEDKPGSFCLADLSQWRFDTASGFVDPVNRIVLYVGIAKSKGRFRRNQLRQHRAMTLTLEFDSSILEPCSGAALLEAILDAVETPPHKWY